VARTSECQFLNKIVAHRSDETHRTLIGDYILALRLDNNPSNSHKFLRYGDCGPSKPSFLLPAGYMERSVAPVGTTVKGDDAGRSSYGSLFIGITDDRRKQD
jgi:hypothetical protein